MGTSRISLSVLCVIYNTLFKFLATSYFDFEKKLTRMCYSYISVNVNDGILGHLLYKN